MKKYLQLPDNATVQLEKIGEETVLVIRAKEVEDDSFTVKIMELSDG